MILAVPPDSAGVLDSAPPVFRCPHQMILGESRPYGWFVVLAYQQSNDEPALFQSEEAIEAPSDWRIPPHPSGRGINRALVMS